MVLMLFLVHSNCYCHGLRSWNEKCKIGLLRLCFFTTFFLKNTRNFQSLFRPILAFLCCRCRCGCCSNLNNILCKAIIRMTTVACHNDSITTDVNWEWKEFTLKWNEDTVINTHVLYCVNGFSHLTREPFFRCSFWICTQFFPLCHDPIPFSSFMCFQSQCI